MSSAAARVGAASAVAAALASIGYGIVQILQITGMLLFPLDELTIFGFSILIPVPYLLAVLALHYYTPPERRFFSHAGVALAGVYATYCCLVYAIELLVSIPLRIQGGNVDPMLLGMTQPQMMFSVDSLGYIFMSLSALLAAFAFAASGPQLKLRYAFLAHGCTALVIMMVMLKPALLLLGSVWLVTAPLALFLLAGHLRNAGLESSHGV